MGKLNLLKANYVGKVGETYGVEQHRKGFVKAIPFSHTPHNDIQNNSCKAFTLLNRLSAVIAKNFWNYLDLSDKKMYKNNAVAKWLKPCLQNHKFVISNISEVILEDNSLQLINFDYDYTSLVFQITLKNIVETAKQENEKVYISVITNNAVTKFAKVEQGQNIFQSGVFDYIDFAYFQLLCFKSIPFYKKHKIKGLVLTAPVYVIIINHIFYVLRWKWSSEPYVLNHTLYLPKGTVFIQNNVFYLG